MTARLLSRSGTQWPAPSRRPLAPSLGTVSCAGEIAALCLWIEAVRIGSCVPVAHATSAASTVSGSIAPFLSHRAVVYLELPRNARFASANRRLNLLDRLFHQAGCLCHVLSQVPVRAVSLTMRSISVRVSSLAN